MANIEVEIDGVRKQMEESLLEKSTGGIDNENEHTTWVEWRLDGKIVKRSVNVHLNRNVLFG